jgi:RNA polymerase sigma-32 factor
VIGWDVGGANTKAARVAHGQLLAVCGRPFAVQRTPELLMPLLREIAADLGVPAKEVAEMEQRLSAHDMSFDPLPVAGEDEDSYGPAAYLSAPEADPAHQAENEDWDQDSSAQLAASLKNLDARSRAIVQRRWLATPKATLHELAAEFGVSAERIRQIEATAFARLRGLLPAPAV